MAKIIAPAGAFSGIRAGVEFKSGVAETDSSYLIDYFRQKGYTIADLATAEKAEAEAKAKAKAEAEAKATAEKAEAEAKAEAKEEAEAKAAAGTMDQVETGAEQQSEPKFTGPSGNHPPEEFDLSDDKATSPPPPSPAPEPSPLDKMTEKELREYAAEKGIDVTSLKAKSSVLKIIKETENAAGK